MEEPKVRNRPTGSSGSRHKRELGISKKLEQMTGPLSGQNYLSSKIPDRAKPPSAAIRAGVLTNYTFAEQSRACSPLASPVRPKARRLWAPPLGSRWP